MKSLQEGSPHSSLDRPGPATLETSVDATGVDICLMSMPFCLLQLMSLIDQCLSIYLIYLTNSLTNYLTTGTYLSIYLSFYRSWSHIVVFELLTSCHPPWPHWDSWICTSFRRAFNVRMACPGHLYLGPWMTLVQSEQGDAIHILSFRPHENITVFVWISYGIMGFVYGILTFGVYGWDPCYHI